MNSQSNTNNNSDENAQMQTNQVDQSVNNLQPAVQQFTKEQVRFS